MRPLRAGDLSCTVAVALGLALGLAPTSARGGAFALAPPGTFDLSGTVRDETGVELSGAVLTLVHEESGRARTATTNDRGRYAFAALRPGEYFLEVRLDGYATSRYAGLRYFADTKPLFHVTLRLRAIQESMTFTGEAPLINVSQSQLGLSLEERQLVELPLDERDYLELVSLEGPAQSISEAPPGLESPRPARFRHALSGADPHYAQYLLDGFTNTRDQHGVAKVDVALPSVEEFRVVSAQYSAEYGGGLAGVVSATTRSGGNDFGGSLYAFVRPGSFRADDPLTGDDTRHSRQDVGLTFGGPVVRDRTQFFTSLEYRNEEEDAVVTASLDGGRFAGVFPLPSDYLRWLGKLSHRFGDRHQVHVTGVVSDRSALEGVGGYDAFDGAMDVDDDDVAVLASWTSELGPVLGELRAGLTRERYRAARRARTALGFVAIHPTGGNVGHPTSLEVAEETSFELAPRISFSAGDHGIALGFRLLRIASEAEIQRARDGVFHFAPGSTSLSEPILFSRSILPDGASPRVDRSETYAQLFLQDDWMLSPQLSLNAGIRWERESSVGDDDNVSPRAGIHWDPGGDGRTSVRAGYGVFYGRVFSAVDTWERAFGPNGQRTLVLTPDEPGFPSPRGGASPAPVREPTNLYVEAPVYAPGERRSPYSQQITAGIEREIADTLSLSVDVSHVRGENLVVPLDLNAPAFFDYASGATRSAPRADASRPFGAPGAPIPSGRLEELPGGFPFSGYRDLYVLSSRGSSRFWGVRVNATKRYATNLLLQAVYHWSRARNDGDDFRVSESLPLVPGELTWGRAATDVPHSLSVNGVWHAPFGLRVTGLLRARSGRAVDPRVDRDLDGDRKLRERPAVGGRILERNGFRSRSVATLDLSLARVWELGAGRRVEGRLDLFNVTNRLNPRQFLRSYGRGSEPLPSFLEIVQAGPPRRVQLSVRFAF